jgi:hypothetical protein
MDHISMDMDQGERRTKLRPRPKQQHIEFRRNKVLEFSSQGRTEREVADILKVERVLYIASFGFLTILIRFLYDL